MPRFFFHTEDDGPHRDEEGAILPDAASAEGEALKVLGELLKDAPGAFWRAGGLTLRVADEHDLTILTLEVSVTRAAAAPGRVGR